MRHIYKRRWISNHILGPRVGMAASDHLYACGPNQRLPHGTGLHADTAFTMVLTPFQLARTHGEYQTKEEAAASAAFVLFCHVLRSCGSGNPARPNYRLVVELIVQAAKFESVLRSGNADVGTHIQPLAYAFTFLFTHEGYDAFSAELESEIAKRKTQRRGAKEPMRIGTHQTVTSFPCLLRMLGYIVDIEPGSVLRISADEPRDPGHLLNILDPKRPLSVLGAAPQQMGMYIQSAANAEDGPALTWSAPWSVTSRGGLNPLVYVFGESLPWNLTGDSNSFNVTALIGTPTPRIYLQRYTERRATAPQKRRIRGWNDELDGPFDKIFRGEDQEIGALHDPRQSVPLFAPSRSRNVVSRAARHSRPLVSEELFGYPALGSLRQKTELMFDAVRGPDDLEQVLDYSIDTARLVETASGGIIPGNYEARQQWGEQLDDLLAEDEWARTFFDKCERPADLERLIQVALAKFFGLSAAQIAFGYGLIFCGQILPLLSMAPPLHIFCIGKAMAGKSLVVEVITSLIFAKAVRRFDSSSAQAAACDTVSDRTIGVIDESMRLTADQLEQWKVMISEGAVRRQRAVLNEETKRFEQKTSLNVTTERTLAVGNRYWQSVEKDDDGIAALETRRMCLVMPNAMGRFPSNTNPHRERARLAFQHLVRKATDVTPFTAMGLQIGSHILSVFYKFLKKRGMSALSSRRQDMFKTVVHGHMQLEMAIACRGKSKRDRVKYYLHNGFFRAEHVASAYKTFCELDQTHVEEIVYKALAGMVEFSRSYDGRTLVGIEVKISDCGGFAVLPATISTNRRSLSALATAVTAAVPEEDHRKIPDSDTILRHLENMVDTGALKIASADQRPRYGLPTKDLEAITLPTDKIVRGTLIKAANSLQIQQVTMDEQSFILADTVVEALTKNEVDALTPVAAGKWRAAVESHGIDALAESIARLKASGRISARRSATMANYVRAEDDTTPANDQKPSSIKPGLNVVEGRKVLNVVVFARLLAGVGSAANGSQTPAERVADEFVSLCSKTSWGQSVTGLARFYGESPVPPTSVIRKPAGGPVIIESPDYEGDVLCDGPTDDKTPCLFKPTVKTINLADDEFKTFDNRLREHHIRANFPNLGDNYAAFEEALQ